MMLLPTARYYVETPAHCYTMFIPIARYDVYTLASEQRQMLAQRLTVMGGGWNVVGKRVGPSAITTLQVQIQIQIGVQI